MADVENRFASASEDVEFVVAASAHRSRWRNRHRQVGGIYYKMSNRSTQTEKQCSWL